MTQYRQATPSELQQLLDWAGAEGWNPGLEDAEAFFAADPEGFFVALQDGEPVAGMSVVNHSDRFAFLGLYMVLPAFRGQGIGFGLWQYALVHAGNRTVGLDGVPEQQANYRMSGFEHAGATTRYTGLVTPDRSAPPAFAGAADIPALIDLEAQASGCRKPAYLSAWFAPAASRKTLVVREDGELAGFCTIRKCLEGAKIGPLWARTPAVAERLIRQAAALFDGAVTLDVPQSAKMLAALCEDLSLTPGFHTARMYKGSFQQPEPDVFAVATLELG